MIFPVPPLIIKQDEHCREEIFVIKIYIRSLFIPVDQVSKERLYQTICQLLEQHEQLEFWLISCRTDFDALAIQIIMDMRKQYPDKTIDIVAVIDPLKYNYTNIEDFPEADYRFPIHSITKLQAAPLIKGKCEQYPERYLLHFKKIEKWIIKQCDVILAFYYEEVPNPLTFEMHRLKKEKVVIPIFNADIAQELLAQIEQLDERSKSILLGLKKGCTYTTLAKERNVSVSRIRQQSQTIFRHLFSKTTKKYM